MSRFKLNEIFTKSNPHMESSNSQTQSNLFNQPDRNPSALSKLARCKQRQAEIAEMEQYTMKCSEIKERYEKLINEYKEHQRISIEDKKTSKKNNIQQNQLKEIEKNKQQLKTFEESIEQITKEQRLAINPFQTIKKDNQTDRKQRKKPIIEHLKSQEVIERMEAIFALSDKTFERIMCVHRTVRKRELYLGFCSRVLRNYIEAHKTTHPGHHAIFIVYDEVKHEERFIFDCLNRPQEEHEKNLIVFHKKNVKTIRKEAIDHGAYRYMSLMDEADFDELLNLFTYQEEFLETFDLDSNMVAHFLKCREDQRNKRGTHESLINLTNLMNKPQRSAQEAITPVESNSTNTVSKKLPTTAHQSIKTIKPQSKEAYLNNKRNNARNALHMCQVDEEYPIKKLRVGENREGNPVNRDSDSMSVFSPNNTSFFYKIEKRNLDEEINNPVLLDEKLSGIETFVSELINRGQQVFRGDNRSTKSTRSDDEEEDIITLRCWNI